MSTSLTPKSLRMVGIATLTMLMSRIDMNAPIEITSTQNGHRSVYTVCALPDGRTGAPVDCPGSTSCGRSSGAVVVVDGDVVPGTATTCSSSDSSNRCFIDPPQIRAVVTATALHGTVGALLRPAHTI